MVSKTNFLILIISCFGILSCSSESEGPLYITIKSNQSALIDASTKSCSASKTFGSTNDIQSFYFNLLGPVIKWTNTGATAYIDSLTIKLRGSNFSGGESVCTISNTELVANFYSSNPTATNIVIEPGSEVKLTGTCAVICGGVQLVDKNRGFSASGTVILKGYQVNTETSESLPIKATSYFTLQYEPL